MRELANLGFIFIEYIFDFFRAIKWSKSSPLCPKEKKYYYEIILLAHTVEKGLSVTNPRMKFGKEKISKLLDFLDNYDFNWDLFPVEKSYGCLNEYIKLHEKNNIDLENIGTRIKSFLNKCEKNNLSLKGGTKIIVPDLKNYTFEEGLLSRYSSRQYEPKIVREETLNRIIDIALRTPSQCNRQSGRIHYYSNKNQIDKLLRLQGGAEGFREDVHNLFIITSDMSAWSGFKARSQSYVDGSLLCMQVLNACFSLKISACPLNLAISNKKELEICKVGNIPTNERLIMMISFGYSVEKEFLVAMSHRAEPINLLTSHK